MTKQDLEQIKSITKQLLEENNKNLVTKDDLKNAFLESNKNLVTKSDLVENSLKLATIFATKQDLEKFVTKDEYHKTVDQILTTLDAIYGKVKNLEPESLIAAHKIQDHEKRLTKVEKHIFAN